MSVLHYSRQAAQSQHLYIHVPFCSGRCSYCAFYSERYEQRRVRQYLQALRREFQALLPNGRRITPRTIYVGGGTPSVLTAGELAELTRVIQDFADLSRLEEWTIEANPGTLGDEALRGIADAGVNRVSLGVQSLADATLQRIGRRHDAGAVRRTVERLRQNGFENIGADLIAGLPGVSPREWLDTIQGVLELEPQHVSVYSLSLEPGSRLFKEHQSGMVSPLSVEDEIVALESATGLLAAAGIERYEVSNYARHDFECRHNVACWQGHDYLGVGPAAASRLGHTRRMNAPSLTDYADPLSVQRLPPATVDTLCAVDDITERFIFSLRLIKGTAIADFSPPVAVAEHWENVLRQLETQGLTTRDGNRWRLTERGLLVADSVATELLPDLS